MKHSSPYLFNRIYFYGLTNKKVVDKIIWTFEDPTRHPSYVMHGKILKLKATKKNGHTRMILRGLLLKDAMELEIILNTLMTLYDPQIFKVLWAL